MLSDGELVKQGATVDVPDEWVPLLPRQFVPAKPETDPPDLED